ncbi:FND3A protein, partial [Polyodon spathula]|nr:FND3A protein [Polyodon spathula]
RFVSLYRGPCHTHKVQRLNESTTYTFRIQAFNEAGEGSFSDVYTFTTPKSPPAPLKGSVLFSFSQLTWRSQQVILYTSSSYCFNIIYKGSARSFQVSGLQLNCEHRFRACAIRQCQNPQGPQDLSGPYSATVTFSCQKTELPSTTHKNTVEVSRTKRTLSDEQCAAVILVLFAIISILIAFVIQYFVIK